MQDLNVKNVYAKVSVLNEPLKIASKCRWRFYSFYLYFHWSNCNNHIMNDGKLMMHFLVHQGESAKFTPRSHALRALVPSYPHVLRLSVPSCCCASMLCYLPDLDPCVPSRIRTPVSCMLCLPCVPSCFALAYLLYSYIQIKELS